MEDNTNSSKVDWERVRDFIYAEVNKDKIYEEKCLIYSNVGTNESIIFNYLEKDGLVTAIYPHMQASTMERLIEFTKIVHSVFSNGGYKFLTETLFNQKVNKIIEYFKMEKIAEKSEIELLEKCLKGW